MNNSEEYDEYLQILTGKHVGTIVLCIFGGILNSIMLYMLLHKKQIRSSVHTVYMVQIAVTDLLVCAIWLIMTSVITHNVFHIPSEGSGLIDHQAVGSNVTSGNETGNRVDEGSQYRSWTIMHSWYNFHYYVNIFLLASMSVERCAAVWKSMRCQRYQYNRKVIIVISIIMWLLALAFVMPEMVNPNLIASESDSPDGISRVLGPNEMSMEQDGDALTELGRRAKANFSEKGIPVGSKWYSSPSTTRPYENETKNFNADMDVLYACYTLLERADRENKLCVESYGKLNVHVCFTEIFAIMTTYDPMVLPEEDTADTPGSDSSIETNNPLILSEKDALDAFASDDVDLFQELATLENYENEDIFESCVKVGVDIAMYHFSLETAVEKVKQHFRRYDKMQSMCYPDLSKPAKIYILIVNLVLGFFVPFSIIVFSYVSIACMIGKRVRNRMNTTLSETSTTHFQQNASSTDGNQAGSIQLREKKTQRNSRNDSMSRRMSDFMRYILLRRPHDGLENRSYMTDSDQHSTPFNSSRKVTHPSQAHRTEEFNYQGNLGVAPQYPKPSTSEQQSSEDDPLHDRQFEEAIRQVSHVRLRNENSRIKYPVFHDTTNDNIPQTIEEHPHEAEGEEEELLRASNGSSIIDGLSQQSVRTTPPVRTVQRNSGSRRESGGSYGSSMDSMATDQTSLIPCIDKRYSGATMTSALTPPTPIEASNPYTNQFFPTGDDRTAHQRMSSGDAIYMSGSGSNDAMKQQYRKSTQRKQPNESELENGRVKDAADGHREMTDGVFPKKRNTSPRDGYSFPPARGRNEQARSNSRFTESQQDHENHKQKLVYNRQTSNTSSIFHSHRRLSSSSKRSTGGSRSSSKKRNLVHKYAEKQLRVSRTLLAYVIVFSLCWLPQRIAYLLYVIEALVGAMDLRCFKLITGVRILSFISVLLNPAVYILTQRQFQEYIRKSACVKLMRRWYTKCFKGKPRNQDIHMGSRYRITSERNDEVDQQVRGMQEERHTSVTTRQNSNTKAPYRMPTQTRPVIHSRPNAGQHEMLFAPPTMRQRDATIDEMKEEEAAAEESLEKEMKRLAAEEEKRRKDDINKNFMESSEDDILSNKTGSGSGNKTTSSSTKSENFEELWKRWMQTGVTKIPNMAPNNEDNTIAGMDSEFDNIETVPIRNGSIERGVLE